MRQILRHSTWRVALVAALSVATTLTLAWGVPMVMDRWGLWGALPRSPDTFWTDGERGGHYTVAAHPLRDSLVFKRIIFTGSVEALPYYNLNQPPRWAAVVSLDQREGFEQVDTAVVGWPMRAFRMERWESWRVPTQATPLPALVTGPDGNKLEMRVPPPPSSEVFRGVLGPFTMGAARVLLPAEPIWLGLSVNFACFSTAWAVLLLGTHAVRRWRRSACGRCPACGYERCGLAPVAVCPECGHSIKPSA